MTQRTTALLAGAFALGLTFATPVVTQAQDQDGQQAAAQDQPGQGRRGRGQGGPGGRGNNPVQMVEQLQLQVNDLQLTDEQKTKLQPIFKDATDRARTVATEVESLQGRERGEKTRAFATETREKVMAVLTDEQKQTLRKNQVSRQAQQFAQRYRRALEGLDLNADQKTKVEAALEASQKKYAEAIAAAPEGGGQGGGGQGGPGREVTQELRAKLNEILTPEQQTKLTESMRQGQGGRGGRRGQGQGNQN